MNRIFSNAWSYLSLEIQNECGQGEVCTTTVHGHVLNLRCINRSIKKSPFTKIVPLIWWHIELIRLDPTIGFATLPKKKKITTCCITCMFSLSFIAFMIHEMVHFLRKIFIPRLPGHAGQRNNAKDRLITKARKYNRKQEKSIVIFATFSFLFSFIN